LTFNSAPDYETKTSYSITVNVSDGTNTTSQELTINISNLTGINDSTTSWSKGLTFASASESCSSSLCTSSDYVEKPQRTNNGYPMELSPFQLWGFGGNGEFNPWAFSTVFKTSSTDRQRLLQFSQINARQFKDMGFLDIDGQTIIFKFHSKSGGAQDGSDTRGLTLTTSEIISTNTWYGIYFEFDGKNTDTNVQSPSNFRAYLVNLSNENLENISPSSNWVNNHLSSYGSTTQFGSAIYRLGTDDFKGTISSFVVTTMLAGATPSDSEIKMMTLDPVKWLTQYKVGNQYRTNGSSGSGGNGPPVQVNNSFALNGSDEGQATQVYLMGDGSGDTHERIKNQVNTDGDSDLITTGLTSSSLETVTIP
jgi:hypothetical protein